MSTEEQSDDSVDLILSSIEDWLTFPEGLYKLAGREIKGANCGVQSTTVFHSICRARTCSPQAQAAALQTAKAAYMKAFQRALPILGGSDTIKLS